MSYKHEHNKLQTFILGTLLGGAVGAAIALLYAPKKGVRLRKDISSGVSDISNDLNRLAKKAKKTGVRLVQGKIEAGDEVLHQTYDKAERLIGEAVKYISDVKDRVTMH